MESELDKFWKQVPKSEEDRITIDSFVQIYREIDDLFENDDNDDEQADDEQAALEQIFDVLCDDDSDNKLISKETLKKWDEIARLLEDGLLGEDEFETLWSKSSSTDTTTLNADGFMTFNALLDDLFVFDDPIENDEEAVLPKTAPKKSMVSGEDLPPGVLFAALANDKYLVGSDELQYWSELQEWLQDGELQSQELQDFFAANAVNEYLTEETFTDFYKAIDDLFEEDEPAGSSDDKLALLEFLDELNMNTDRLPCGLEAEEQDEKLVQNIVSTLENDVISNEILKKSGNIGHDNLIGDWVLLYCSSSAVKFNQGLSGLGGSMPNGKFGGLTQKLEFSKFKQDVTYTEQIACTPDTASFEVKVNGAWELRKSISLFTNKPCTMLSVEPDRVQYGPTSTRGDHWKSLGPMNMLDVTYLDDDLRIMRGNTATDAIFVFKRI
jgi:hypothetical protein